MTSSEKRDSSPASPPAQPSDRSPCTWPAFVADRCSSAIGARFGGGVRPLSLMDDGTLFIEAVHPLARERAPSSAELLAMLPTEIGGITLRRVVVQ